MQPASHNYQHLLALDARPLELLPLADDAPLARVFGDAATQSWTHREAAEAGASRRSPPSCTCARRGSTRARRPDGRVGILNPRFGAPPTPRASRPRPQGDAPSAPERPPGERRDGAPTAPAQPARPGSPARGRSARSPVPRTAGRRRADARGADVHGSARGPDARGGRRADGDDVPRPPPRIFRRPRRRRRRVRVDARHGEVSLPALPRASAPVWKSTSVSVLGDDVAAAAPSSGEEPTSPRHRAGVASMAWRSTR